MNTFVWSDPHINHVNLAEKYRTSFGGGTVQSHDAAIREAWNDTVGLNDEVWLIGDAAMGKRAVSVPFFATLHGRKHLIPGNHDDVHPMYDKKTNFREKVAFYSQFFTIHDTIELGDEIFGISNTIVSHFPWLGSYVDHAEAERGHYDKWHPERDRYGNDIVIIHGHTHASEIFGDHSVHVGVDAHPNGPIPVEVLAGYVETARQRDAVGQ